MNFIRSPKVRIISGVFIGSVWVFHGLYSKIYGGIPRHRLIIARILGDGYINEATLLIGLLEVILGIWVFSGRKRCACALFQTAAIIGMNSIEILLARDLLISPAGMLLLNALFLFLVWQWASDESS